MVKVKFNQPSEFCYEMEKDASNIDRGIVRTTLSYQVSSMSPNIHHVFAVATYSILDQIIEMEKFAGDIWRVNQEQDDKVLNQAGEYLKKIEDKAKLLKLELRSGRLEN